MNLLPKQPDVSTATDGSFKLDVKKGSAAVATGTSSRFGYKFVELKLLLIGHQTAIYRSQVWVLAGHHCVVALDKLRTPVCLCCYQAKNRNDRVVKKCWSADSILHDDILWLHFFGVINIQYCSYLLFYNLVPAKGWSLWLGK